MMGRLVCPLGITGVIYDSQECPERTANDAVIHSTYCDLIT
jgi:hypothetical protein